MKPVKQLPVRYGEKKAARYEEVQKFVAEGCKYAIVDGFSDTKSGDVEGYRQVLNAFDFGCQIRVHEVNSVIYLERL